MAYLNMKKSPSLLSWIFLVFIGVTPLMLWHCSDPCKCPGFSDVSAHMMSFFPYHEGNYFIYRLKQDTTVRDTVTCSGVIQGLNGCDHNDTRTGTSACTKFYITRLHHSNKTYFPHYWDSTIASVEEFDISAEGFETLYCQRVLKANGSGSARDMLFFPYELGKKPFNDQSKYILIKDSFETSVGQNIFKNCILAKYTWDIVEGNRDFDSLYFCPDVGIVKYNDDFMTWELIEYHIK